jgi:hypothetical protein
MVQLFVCSIYTRIEEMVGNYVFAVGVLVVVIVEDHVGNHQLDSFQCILVWVDLSHVERSVFILLSNLFRLLFNIDDFT